MFWTQQKKNMIKQSEFNQSIFCGGKFSRNNFFNFFYLCAQVNHKQSSYHWRLKLCKSNDDNSYSQLLENNKDQIVLPSSSWCWCCYENSIVSCCYLIKFMVVVSKTYWSYWNQEITHVFILYMLASSLLYIVPFWLKKYILYLYELIDTLL